MQIEQFSFTKVVYGFLVLTAWCVFVFLFPFAGFGVWFLVSADGAGHYLRA